MQPVLVPHVAAGTSTGCLTVLACANTTLFTLCYLVQVCYPVLPCAILYDPGRVILNSTGPAGLHRVAH
jgi:hypothetical protein